MDNTSATYRSTKRISNANLQQLKSDLRLFLRQQRKIFCKSLKRNISLDKLPDALMRRHDVKRRLQTIMVALDIVKHAIPTKKEIKGCMCFEFRGCDADGNPVIAHVREEIIRNDRVLFFVSCY